MRKAGGNTMDLYFVYPGKTTERQDIINKLADGVLLKV
jgi:hypothetical protein